MCFLHVHNLNASAHVGLAEWWKNFGSPPRYLRFKVEVQYWCVKSSIFLVYFCRFLLSELSFLILKPGVAVGRGVWIPTTPNEAMWFGISQWFGLQSDIALNYVLPNMDNFGCRLYSETDLYHGGTGEHKSDYSK